MVNRLRRTSPALAGLLLLAALPSSADGVVWSYDPLFNFPRTTTDPRGNVPGATEALRASFTTRNVFDYEELPIGQGGIDPTGLGDFNADGVVGAPEGGRLAGNVIGVISPPVPTYVDGTHDSTTLQQSIERFAHNHRGQRTRSTDPLGNHDVFVYYGPLNPLDPPSQWGYLKESIRAAGSLNLRTSFGHDLVGNVTRVTDPRGHTTEQDVNALNLVTEIRSRPVTITREDGVSPLPIRYVTRFKHDRNDNVIETEHENIGPDGLPDPLHPVIRTRQDYDVLDNAAGSSMERSPGAFLSHEYKRNPSEDLETSIQPLRNQRRHEYDERNLPLAVFPGYGSAVQAVERYGVDRNGNQTSITDDNGNRMIRRYDGFDRLVETIAPEGNRQINFHDEAGNIIRTESRGNATVGGMETLLAATERTFDALNRATETRRPWFDTVTGDPLGEDGLQTTRFLFDLDSRLRKTFDDNDHPTETVYDTADREVATIDANGNALVRFYDANSNVIRTEEHEVPTGPSATPATFETIFGHDELDRLVRVIDSANEAQRYGYDSRGNRRFHVDGEGNVTRAAVDGLSRMTRAETVLTVDGIGGSPVTGSIVVDHAWDDNSRLMAQTDDNQNPTTTGFDAQNRPEHTEYADRLCASVQLDGVGRVQARTDQNGSQVTNTFDRNDRLIHVQVQRGAGVLGTTEEGYRYDGLNRRLREENENFRTDRRFDSLGRVIEETLTVLASGRTYRTAWEFDGVGNEIRCAYPSGRVITRAYTLADQLMEIRDAAGLIARYEYLGPMRVTLKVYGNGVACVSTYDADRRIESMTHNGPFGLIAGFGYGYNRQDMRLFEQRAHEGNTGDAYEYDSAYRLRTAFLGLPDPVGGTGTPQGTQSWDLDDVGNWRTFSEDGVPRSFGIDEMNAYTSVDGVAQIFDGNGNLLRSSDGLDLLYDYRNRLLSAQRAGQLLVENRYDTTWRRVQVVKGGQETTFIYAGARVIEERDSSGLLLTDHVWGIGIDELIQTRNGTGTFFFHPQAIGSIAAATNTIGQVVERYKYTPYGVTTITNPFGQERATSAIGNRYMFTGREYEKEAALYYYRHRWYQPATGRFTGRDPAGYQNGMGLYEYVAGRPVSLSDPFGLRMQLKSGFTEAERQGVEDDLNAMATGSGYRFEVVNDGRAAGTVRVTVPGVAAGGGMRQEVLALLAELVNDPGFLVTIDTELAREDVPREGSGHRHPANSATQNWVTDYRHGLISYDPIRSTLLRGAGREGDVAEGAVQDLPTESEHILAHEIGHQLQDYWSWRWTQPGTRMKPGDFLGILRVEMGVVDMRSNDAATTSAVGRQRSFREWFAGMVVENIFRGSPRRWQRGLENEDVGGQGLRPAGDIPWSPSGAPGWVKEGSPMANEIQRREEEARRDAQAPDYEVTPGR